MRIPTTKRLEEIVRQLEKKGYVKAKELSKQYEVSMETIRKDLTYLEEKGIAKKEYGGASLSPLSIERSTEFRKNKYDEKKRNCTICSEIIERSSCYDFRFRFHMSSMCAIY